MSKTGFSYRETMDDFISEKPIIPKTQPESTTGRGQKFEDHINSLFPVGEEFDIDGEIWTVITSGKPKIGVAKSGAGEGKTDVYVLAENAAGEEKEIKISVKKNNAEFVENKISAERAKSVFGDDWQEKLKPQMDKLTEYLRTDERYRPDSVNSKGEKTLRLGYRLDIMKRKSGTLSVKADFDRDTVREVWSGENLSGDKKDSYVNGVKIADSGVANNIVVGDVDDYPDAQSVVDSMMTIDEYLDEGNDELWMSIKAVNLRDNGKYESGRFLAISYQYRVEDGELKYDIDTSNMLETRSAVHRSTVTRDVEEVAFG